MRVSELRDELRERAVDFSDCFDKESLCQRLEDARNNNGNNMKTKQETSNTTLIDKDGLLQEIRSMSVRSLREDLARRSIRWAGLLEKEDLVQAVYQARIEAQQFSVTGQLVPGTVTEVNGDALMQELGKTDTPLLLDVFATWCGPCQLVAPQLKAVAAKMGTKLRVCKMDSDKEQSTAAQFRIQGLPTLILFQGGKEVNRVEGAMMEPQIIAWIEKELGIAV
ncbi:thioredoxin 1 [Fistulifera solaris]|uniref:Thioredoxin 1 n=1 Tax=Fistulifera solaris TaxID=1519565 RepID=A0A1Z5JDD0_FISSO|nr:thioredoxin 1 [Fistulifera solaris]|eukprot:GAX12013.1 thioredoxin 1 [Fistulifera solaris]